MESCIEKSLPDPGIDAKSMMKELEGQAVALVVSIEPRNLNLTGRKARNIRYADDEVTIQFYATAVSQLWTVESSRNSPFVSIYLG